MSRTILKGGMVLTFINEAYEATKIQESDILIDNGLVEEISPFIQEEQGDEVVHIPGQMVIPGLINAHNHTLTTAVCRGMTDDYNRENYGGSALYTRVFPLKRIALEILNEEEIAAILKMALVEMIQSGATTVGEQCTGKEFGIFVDLVDELGIRASICPMYTSGEHLPELKETGKIDIGERKKEMEVLEENIRLYEQYQGDGEGRVEIWLGPHAPDSCSQELLMETARAAEELDTKIMIHLAQTRIELDKIRERFGSTPVEYLDKIGFLSSRVVAAHGLFTNNEDQKIIKDNQVNIVHCPQVFVKGGMIAPFHPYMEKEVTVSLGTDSYAMDMMAEMRMAALVGKLHTQNAHSVTASDAFFAATVGGAKAFGRSDLGRLVEGQKADITVIDMQKSHIQPVAIPVINLVYHVNAADVSYVFVDGKAVKTPQGIVSGDDRKIVDDGKVVSEKIWAAARQEGVL